MTSLDGAPAPGQHGCERCSSPKMGRSGEATWPLCEKCWDAVWEALRSADDPGDINRLREANQIRSDAGLHTLPLPGGLVGPNRMRRAWGWPRRLGGRSKVEADRAWCGHEYTLSHRVTSPA